MQFELGPLLAAGRTDNLVAGFCCVVVRDRPEAAVGLVEMPIVISALDIPIGKVWELRTSGLWAEQICEHPFQHWSYGLEAFGLAIDRPDELLRRGLGHRVPVGWELDFIAADEPVGSELTIMQRGRGEGILLTADGEVSVDGEASRAFWSGRAPDISNLKTLAHSSSAETDGDRNERVTPIAIVPTQSGPWIVR